MKRRVPHTGRFEAASQADDGTIVALRGLDLHRLNRRGKLLNKPFTTAFRRNPVTPAFNGPFSPEISPDGKTVAYTYSFIASHFDPACQCNRISPSMNTSYTWSNRFTDSPEGLRPRPLPLERVLDRQLHGVTDGSPELPSLAASDYSIPNGATRVASRGVSEPAYGEGSATDQFLVRFKRLASPCGSHAEGTAPGDCEARAKLERRTR